MKSNENNVVDAFAWNLAQLAGYMHKNKDLRRNDPHLNHLLETIESQAEYVEKVAKDDIIGETAKNVGEIIFTDEACDALGIREE